MNARGLWLLARDWLERLAPFAPRLRGPLAAHVADALLENSLSSLPDLPFVPVVQLDLQLDLQGDDLRALLRSLDPEPSAIERARERGRTTIFVEGFVPVELWLRAGPRDELPFLGPAATLAEIARLVERFCPP